MMHIPTPSAMWSPPTNHVIPGLCIASHRDHGSRNCAYEFSSQEILSPQEFGGERIEQACKHRVTCLASHSSLTKQGTCNTLSPTLFPVWFRLLHGNGLTSKPRQQMKHPALQRSVHRYAQGGVSCSCRFCVDRRVARVLSSEGGSRCVAEHL